MDRHKNKHREERPRTVLAFLWHLAEEARREGRQRRAEIWRTTAYSFSRFLEGKKDWSMRMIGSRMIGAAIRLTTGARLTDPTSGMRLFSRKMIEEFALNLNYGPEPDTISFLIKQGARVAEVPVIIDERTAGESYLKPLTAASYMARMLISILVIQNFRKRQGEA